MVRLFVSALLGTLGLSSDVRELTQGALPQSPTVVSQCVVLRGEQFGQLPLEVKVGSANVRFTAWKTADADATQVVGFTYVSTGAVHWVAQSGSQLLDGSESDWLLPDAFRGGRSRVLSSLRLCAS
ncbi:MAG: hypothetical protein K1X64_20750 [Myxococcaceae bacterium]|nr:hypothetical protein [Myxococcaceae bacterium]